MTRDGDQTAFWDEPTFWHLFAVEAARARRSRRGLLILIADVLETSQGADSRFARQKVRVPELAAALVGCLRETDLVGWHRTDCMAAGVLTEIDPNPEVGHLVGDKVFRGLSARLPVEVGHGLRVRVYRYGASDDRSFHRLYSSVRGGGAMRGPAGSVLRRTNSLGHAPAAERPADPAARRSTVISHSAAT